MDIPEKICYAFRKYAESAGTRKLMRIRKDKKREDRKK